MATTIAYIGEIVGKIGVFAVKTLLPRLLAERHVDFVVANADSATGGAGLGKQHAMYLRKLGVDCITTGDCAFCKRDSAEYLPAFSFVLRPANFPTSVPGRGIQVYRIQSGPIAVVQLLGQAGFSRVHLDNPFVAIDGILERLAQETRTVIFDFHASPTAEKLAMARHVDGRVSAVIGSHLRTLTADARITGAGTAMLTDAGRTGSLLSVGGADPATRVGEYLSGVPTHHADGSLGIELQGCIIEIGEDGKALSIEAIRIPCQEVPNERTGNGDGDRR